MDKIYSPEQQAAIDNRQALVARVGACSRILSELSSFYSDLIKSNIDANDGFRQLGLNYIDATRPSENEITEQVGYLLQELTDKFAQANTATVSSTELQIAS